MHCMPVSVIPKPHTDKFHVINGHSAGKYSCNSIIVWKDISVKLDGMCMLEEDLHKARKIYGNTLSILFKSDVS